MAAGALRFRVVRGKHEALEFTAAMLAAIFI
jgi:hypothetical protein